MVSSRHNRGGDARKRLDDDPSDYTDHKYHAQNDIERGDNTNPAQHVLRQRRGNKNPLPPRFRFRDAIATTMDQQDVTRLKSALRAGIDQSTPLEDFRRSDEELKGMANKKVRAFYREQNERLDDWLEVDALVLAMAEDVLDSMNPRDFDHDGIAEAGGALQATAESVEPLLPEDERERRRKAVRRARWAINVSGCSFSFFFFFAGGGWGPFASYMPDLG